MAWALGQATWSVHLHQGDRIGQEVMKLRVASAGLFGALLALAGLQHPLFKEQPIMVEKAVADEVGRAPRASTVPLARDPSVAVAEEYELARKKGTVEAFELFIARHGDSPLAEKAREELKRLSR
jgi:hypothetical protein